VTHKNIMKFLAKLREDNSHCKGDAQKCYEIHGINGDKLYVWLFLRDRQPHGVECQQLVRLWSDQKN